MTDPSGDPRPNQPPDVAGSSASAADPTVAVPSGESQPDTPQAATPPAAAAAPTPADLGRRKFFRAFAGELINTAAMAAGAAAGTPAGVRRGGQRHPQPGGRGAAARSRR